jgi:mannitol/fructose-specific phosphotransferase system IIA component (Ntr-type)/Kef-type K+ transport system membrane component KefB
MALADLLFTLSAVFLAAWLLGGVAWPLALILGAIAIETSPGTVLSVVNETRSRGVFVKTLVAAVALTDVACIVVFELAHSAGRMALGTEATETWSLVFSPLKQLSIAAAIGAACGAGFLLAARRLQVAQHHATASLLSVLFAWGVAHLVGASSILACMFFGVTLANVGRGENEAGLSSFTTFEPAIYAVFFTLAGVHLEFHHLAAAGVLAVIVFVARSAGKVAGASVGLKLAGAPAKMTKYLGWAMLPHASIAVGLMLLVQSDPAFAEIKDTILAVGLSVVALSEVIGPIFMRLALSKSGEMDQMGPRLLDFLHEADISIGLHAKTKREAVEQMVQQLVRTHRLTTDADALIDSVMKREDEVSTCLGGGLMIPHAELTEGDELLGVMAICPDGLPFETPDDQPVRCIVLLATPPSQREHHLEVLAALTRAIGLDPTVRAQLFASKTAAHACEVLHAKEAATFNYFFEHVVDQPVSVPPQTR